MTIPTNELREKLTAALSEVTLAERSLEQALGALNARPRAEKVAVTAVVTEAFARLRNAHAALTELRAMIEDD